MRQLNPVEAVLLVSTRRHCTCARAGVSVEAPLTRIQEIVGLEKGRGGAWASMRAGLGLGFRRRWPGFKGLKEGGCIGQWAVSVDWRSSEGGLGMLHWRSGQ
eukprot:149880-Chlamydomonas_euryale.AAC.2